MIRRIRCWARSKRWPMMTLKVSLHNSSVCHRSRKTISNSWPVCEPFALLCKCKRLCFCLFVRLLMCCVVLLCCMQRRCPTKAMANSITTPSFRPTSPTKRPPHAMPCHASIEILSVGSGSPSPSPMCSCLFFKCATELCALSFISDLSLLSATAANSKGERSRQLLQGWQRYRYDQL